jgi:hypothetical protein
MAQRVPPRNQHLWRRRNFGMDGGCEFSGQLYVMLFHGVRILYDLWAADGSCEAGQPFACTCVMPMWKGDVSEHLDVNFVIKEIPAERPSIILWTNLYEREIRQTINKGTETRLENKRRKSVKFAAQDTGVSKSGPKRKHNAEVYTINKQTTKQTPWPLVRERTIPTERPPLVNEI